MDNDKNIDIPIVRVKTEQPILQSDKYLPAVQEGGISPEEKKKFVENYYETGNQSLAAKSVNRTAAVMKYAMSVDKAFLEDFLAVRNAMKHNLEQTMYQNGLKEKGYMDRITWLRKNYPKEYNPNYVDKDNNPAEAIKELTSKLEKYTMIPKKSIIEVDDV
jgi:hypothetical protein